MSTASGVTETRISTKDSSDRKLKRINSWETKNAIVYDVSSQTLLKTERTAIEGMSSAFVNVKMRY